LIILTQNIYNIIEIIIHVKFESQIAVHDLSNQFLTAISNFTLAFNSSLILSNISILASIAIQTDKINHATEASVNTTQKDLITNIVTTE